MQKNNMTGMPDNQIVGIEELPGFSMDDVRLYYDSNKPAAVQTHAYTQGTDIHIAPGQERHLPHEAWHVAQQMAGRVQPTTEIGGMPVNDNVAIEHETDIMGTRANIYGLKVKKRPKISCRDLIPTVFLWKYGPKLNIFNTFVIRAVQLNRDREKGNKILDKQPGLYARSSVKILLNFSC